jgi:REP element-mobilizing transposase RayT
MMTPLADPYKFHTRRSIRLQGYDYTQDGGYFITICTHERRCLFGQCINDDITLSAWGKIAYTCWNDIPKHYSQVELDMFVVMPNHIHGILVISSGMIYHATTPHTEQHPLQERQFSKPISGSISTIVGVYKAGVTREINRISDKPHVIWQRNYYEHIIRSEKELMQIRQYIENNPANWQTDTLFMAL